MPYDDHRAEFYDKGRSTHETLGEVDYHHLPLNVLRTHFPHAYELLETYPSYALTRDPMERFCSGVVYQFHQIKGNPRNGLTPETFKKEAEEIVRLLEGSVDDLMLPSKIIHFTAQSKYIKIDNEIKIGNIYKIEEMEKMFDDISLHIGKSIRWSKSGQSLKYRSRHIAKADDYAQKIVKTALPRRVWKPAFSLIKSSFERIGILEKEFTNEFKSYIRKSDVDFIYEYYRSDFDLHNGKNKNN